MRNQYSFWIFFAPLIFLLTLLVMLIQGGQEQVPFALSGFLGLALSWKWRLKGLPFGIFLQITNLWWVSHSIPHGMFTWYLGLSIAIILNSIVTALSAEEVETQLQNEEQQKDRLLGHITVLETEKNHWALERKNFTHDIQQQSEKYLQNEKNYENACKELQSQNIVYQNRLNEAEAQKKLLQDSWRAKEDELHKNYSVRISALEKEKDQNLKAYKEKNEELQRSASSQFLAKEEQLKNSLRDSRQELERLQIEKKELEGTFNRLQQEIKQLHSEKMEQRGSWESQVQRGVESLATKEKELEQAVLESQKWKALAEEVEPLSKAHGEVQQKIEKLTEELEPLRRAKSEMQQMIEKHAEEAESLRKGHEERQKKIEVLILENSQLGHYIHQIESERTSQDPHKEPQAATAMFKQLKTQFEQKSAILDETRRLLFLEQEKNSLMLLEKEEQALYGGEEEQGILKNYLALEKELRDLENQFKEETQAFSSLIQSLFKQLSE